MMLIVAYVINHALVSNVNKHGQGSGCSGTGIVLLTLFITFTIGNIIWIIYQFILFSGCGGNVAIMIITCVVSFVLYGVVLLRTR